MEVKIKNPISDDWAENEQKLWQAILDYLEDKYSNTRLHGPDILSIAEKAGLKEFANDYFGEYLWNVDADVTYADLEKGYECKSYIDKDLIEGLIVTIAWTDSPYCSIWEREELELTIAKRNLEAENKAKQDWIEEQIKKYEGDIARFAAVMYDKYIGD